MRTSELAFVALLAVRDQRVGLALAPRTDWQDLYGLRMARLELPGAAHQPGERPQAEALAVGVATFERRATPLPTRWTYGPSPRHAVDRSPATDADAAPFLRFERMLPGERESGAPPRLVAIEVYRATLADPAPHAPSGASERDPAATASALLWLPVAALRVLVGGARLGDLLALDGVAVEQARSDPLPPDTHVYLPSDYGERHLLRIAAKYGEDALFSVSAGR